MRDFGVDTLSGGNAVTGRGCRRRAAVFVLTQGVDGAHGRAGRAPSDNPGGQDVAGSICVVNARLDTLPPAQLKKILAVDARRPA